STRRPPCPTAFPYTTLFRSQRDRARPDARVSLHPAGVRDQLAARIRFDRLGRAAATGDRALSAAVRETAVYARAPAVAVPPRRYRAGRARVRRQQDLRARRCVNRSRTGGGTVEPHGDRNDGAPSGGAT